MATTTLICEGRVVEVAAHVDGDKVRLPTDALRAALGWELKPEGLCKADQCIPIRQRAGLVDATGVDLLAVADLLGQPFAWDADERVGYLGASAIERSNQLASLHAPDFTLPDLDGRLHSLSDYRGRKILLVAYASW